MTRRDLFASLTGALSAAGLTAKVKAIEAEPAPLCLVVTFDKDGPGPTDSGIAYIKDHLAKLIPNCPPVIVCVPGMDVKAVMREAAKHA